MATTTTKEHIATGRRKTAVASIWAKPGKGVITVNGKDFIDYFTSLSIQNDTLHPFEITNTVHAYDIKAKVRGGGITSQAGALRLAFSRFLLATDESYRSILRSKNLLTRDPRMKERKKAGQPGARKRFQFSKR